MKREARSVAVTVLAFLLMVALIVPQMVMESWESEVRGAEFNLEKSISNITFVAYQIKDWSNHPEISAEIENIHQEASEGDIPGVIIQSAELRRTLSEGPTRDMRFISFDLPKGNLPAYGAIDYLLWNIKKQFEIYREKAREYNNKVGSWHGSLILKAHNLFSKEKYRATESFNIDQSPLVKAWNSI